MKTLRTLIIITAGIFAAQYCRAQSSTMKDPVEFKLKNGLTVIVAENSSTSKVYSNFTIDAEPIAESNKAGIDYLLNAILNETATQTEANVTFDEKGGNLASLSADFDEELAMLSTVIEEPIINQSSFEKAKTKIVASIKAKNSYYPKSVTVAALKQLTLNDILTFYSKHITPSRAYLTIAGNITVDKAKNLVKKSFGDWDETALYAVSK